MDFNYLEKYILTNESYNQDDLIEIINKKDKIYLYGAGSGGATTLKWLEQNSKCEIMGFIDSDIKKQGEFLSNKRIFSPQEILKDSDILIASTYHTEISKYLEENGFLNYISLPIDLIIWDKFKTIKYFNDIKEINKLREVYEILEDSTSKEFFIRTLLYRWSWDSSFIKQSKYSQYCIENIQKSNIHTIVDAGAFDGDTIKVFSGFFPSLKNIFAFEPTKKNILKIIEYSLNKKDNLKIFPVEKGLWDSEEQLSFFETDSIGGNNKIIEDSSKENGLNKINVIDLDSFLKNNSSLKIDLIKMDIEGAEYKALLDSKKTIFKNNPILEICIYHDIDHYYDIISFLENNYQGVYVYQIGHHSDWMMETVLYAIPKEKIER